MRLLYIFSDFLFIITFYIIGYRKKVVFNNLKLAFPDKNESKIKTLTQKNIKHFCDFLVESIKAFSISEKEVKKRYVFKNPELLNNVAKNGKSIILTGAHFNNWEWSVSMSLISEIQIFGTYKEVKNQYLDSLIKRSRTKFGLIASTTKNTIPDMLKNFKKGLKGGYILLSDQNPAFSKTYHWQTFFGVKVPVHTGAELLAKKFDMSVVNYSTKKIKRGYYETTFELITDSPKEFKDYEITDKYLEITERNIRMQPENYLWTHKRFRHKDKYEKWLNIRKKASK